MLLGLRCLSSAGSAARSGTLLACCARRHGKQRCMTRTTTDHFKQQRILPSYSPATFAVIAIDDKTCAVASMLRQTNDPPIIFCGTTTISPGCIMVAKTLSLYFSPECLPTTEPLARITNMSLWLAMSVGPPARFRYHPAFFPGA